MAGLFSPGLCRCHQQQCRVSGTEFLVKEEGSKGGDKLTVDTRGVTQIPAGDARNAGEEAEKQKV